MFRFSVFFMALVLSGSVFSCKTPRPLTPASYVLYPDYPVYTGEDLGLQYASRQSTFKIWAPNAQEVKLMIYSDGESGAPLETHALEKGRRGVWYRTLAGDYAGRYYTFQVKFRGQWLPETVDPYVRAVGVNGQRGYIFDLGATNPEGWMYDRRPPLAQPTDAVIYELHLRDFTGGANAGSAFPGQYLGMAESDTRSPDGLATGLAHLKEMGITHVHLLPVFDFRSIDERLPRESRPYNWGYDPHLYNVPEGTYASDPFDPPARIREFKQMVQALHSNGLAVVMDVVYNHTGETEGSVFNRIEPGYYYRLNPDSSYSNASACGNETASENPMMRKFMIESMKYWASEYHIDGFRIDLMGIHDIETINELSKELHRLDPGILIYGEGWTAGPSPLPDSLRAIKANTYLLDRVAAFSDDFRDGVKGYVFDPEDRGFASGKKGQEESVKFGIVAATFHPQVDYAKVNYSKSPWAAEPFHCVNYVSCHDNHTLWDRFRLSCPEDSEQDKIRMQKLAGAMVLTSQGIPFLHAGVEMARTKQGVENSFESPDSINQIDWARKKQYPDLAEYYRSLVRLRKAHPAFRMPSAQMIREHIEFLDTGGAENFIAYRIKDHANGDPWKQILVLFNGNRRGVDFRLPEGNWMVVADQNRIDEKGLRSLFSPSLRVPPISALILVDQAR